MANITKVATVTATGDIIRIRFCQLGEICSGIQLGLQFIRFGQCLFAGAVSTRLNQNMTRTALLFFRKIAQIVFIRLADLIFRNTLISCHGGTIKANVSDFGLFRRLKAGAVSIVVRLHIVVGELNIIHQVASTDFNVRNCSQLVIQHGAKAGLERRRNGGHGERLSGLIYLDVFGQIGAKGQRCPAIQTQNTKELFLVETTIQLKGRNIDNGFIDNSRGCIQAQTIGLNGIHILLNQLFNSRLAQQLVVKQVFIKLLAKLTTQVGFLLFDHPLNFRF